MHRTERKLIGAIRDFAPNLIVTSSHSGLSPGSSSHRALVQDSAYLLQVPSIAPEHTPLSRMPSILLTYDRFQDPRPFRFDWVVDTGSVQDNVIQLLACHASQCSTGRSRCCLRATDHTIPLG